MNRIVSVRWAMEFVVKFDTPYTVPLTRGPAVRIRPGAHFNSQVSREIIILVVPFNGYLCHWTV